MIVTLSTRRQARRRGTEFGLRRSAALFVPMSHAHGSLALLTVELSGSILLIHMFRRAFAPVLAALLLLAVAVPASAGGRMSAHARKITRVAVQTEGRGSLIAVTYSGRRHHVRFLHSPAPIDRVAVRDVDNDGDPDIIAAPHNGDILVWHNKGQGAFDLATLPPPNRVVPNRGPRFVRFLQVDDGLPWGDLRYDAALPRAPAISAAVSLSFVRTSLDSFDPTVSFRRLTGRAPPSA
jgi:hypothetical protein